MLIGDIAMATPQPEVIVTDRSTILDTPIRVGVSCPVCGNVHEDGASIIICRRKYLVDSLASQKRMRDTQRIIIEKIIARLESNL
jgi:hypothetical protein